VWHVLTKEQDYLWVRPALHATKLRRLELTAGHAPARGQRGSAYDYNIKATCAQERRRVQQAEKIYERFVAGWNRNGPRVIARFAVTRQPDKIYGRDTAN
jgi:hypothetical protein